MAAPLELLTRVTDASSMTKLAAVNRRARRRSRRRCVVTNRSLVRLSHGGIGLSSDGRRSALAFCFCADVPRCDFRLAHSFTGLLCMAFV
jgi:hypothetical protein